MSNLDYLFEEEYQDDQPSKNDSKQVSGSQKEIQN